jgi:hypothetical protein
MLTFVVANKKITQSYTCLLLQTESAFVYTYRSGLYSNLIHYITAGINCFSFIINQ